MDEEKKQPNMYATLFIRPIWSQGTENYFIWDLILFTAKDALISVGSLTGNGRFANQNEAMRQSEYYAKLLNIEINRKALLG